MSVIGFHRVLIATGILFCGLFAGWQGVAFARDGSLGDLILAVFFALAAVGLVYYLANLDRFLDRKRSR